MLNNIKIKIERALANYIQELDRSYSLSKISPILFKNIKDFVLRKGKRVRPILFVIGYLGYAKQAAPGLYAGALSLELLHDFMLAHDDIIDKSEKRRGKPSLHKALNKYLKKFHNIKFTGQDLAIVLADVMCAMGIHTFLSIKEDRKHKEDALRRLIEAVIYTGSGEFTELLMGTRDIEDISKKDIYKIYDLKTAYYTFACPLSAGAILAGAKPKQVNSLFRCGKYLGRVFQIKDDILGMFGEENKIGKSSLADLQEAKRTLLIWYAYHKSAKKNRSDIKKILTKERVNKSDLLKTRKIIIESGALDYLRKESLGLMRSAQALGLSFKMHKKYKYLLFSYAKELLNLHDF